MLGHKDNPSVHYNGVLPTLRTFNSSGGRYNRGDHCGNQAEIGMVVSAAR